MGIPRFAGKRKLTLLFGAVIFALAVIPSIHLYWHSAEHNEACNAEHVCLICTVFTSTTLDISISIPIILLLTLDLPLILRPISNRSLRLEASIPARAPPIHGLS
jgi:hypothetical protein